MRGLLAGASAILCLSLVACGGSGRPAEPTLSPPPIDPRLRVLEQGAMTLDIGAGATETLDPAALALDAGLPLACGDVVFLFVWRVQQQETVEVAGRLTGDRFAIGEGRQGQASVNGCILLEAVNEAKSAVAVDLRFFIAEVRR